MMYKNLKAEMARSSILGKDIAKALGTRQATISSRLTGKTEFSYREAKKIKDIFFPHIELEYLFEETVSNGI